MLQTELNEMSLRVAPPTLLPDVNEELLFICANPGLQSLQWGSVSADENLLLITESAGIDIFLPTRQRCSEIERHLNKTLSNAVVLCYTSPMQSLSIALDIYECLRQKWTVRVALLVEPDLEKQDCMTEVLKIGTYVDSLRLRYFPDLEVNCFCWQGEVSRAEQTFFLAAEKYLHFGDNWLDSFHAIFDCKSRWENSPSRILLRQHFRETGTPFIESSMMLI